MMNYFEFYNMPVTIEMDQSTLKKTFFKNSRSFHPDMHVGADDEVLKQIDEKSTLNTEAYEVLGDFDLRLKHVVTILSGGQIDAPQLSPDFLMEMMEINESVESMSEDEKSSLRKEIIERDLRLYKELGDLVHRDLSETTNAERALITSYYFQRKYLLRILENLDNLAAL